MSSQVKSPETILHDSIMSVWDSVYQQSKELETLVNEARRQGQNTVAEKLTTACRELTLAMASMHETSYFLRSPAEECSQEK